MQLQSTETDSIDRIRQQWRRERAELDTKPMETIGRILRIQFLAGMRMRRIFRQYRLDAGGFDVLATLRRSGAPHRLTPTQLYQQLVLTSGAMTNRIDVLENMELVQREPDPDDRRGTLIRLTRRGRQVIDEAMPAHLRGETAMVAHLSISEQKTLGRLLGKLLRGLENQDERQ